MAMFRRQDFIGHLSEHRAHVVKCENRVKSTECW